MRENLKPRLPRLTAMIVIGWALVASTVAHGAPPSGKPLTAMDKLSIMELAARFEMSLDREDVDGYLATFVPDGTGVLESSFGPPAKGNEALNKAFFGMLNAFARGQRHCSMNQIITGNDHEATMVSYLVVFNRNELERTGSALVTDKAVKIKGVWYLTSRKIDVDPSFGKKK